MEIEPRRQKTWPDFAVTEKLWGVRAVDTADVGARAGSCSTIATGGRRGSAASTTA